jgi:hypothetical protein
MTRPDNDLPVQEAFAGSVAGRSALAAQSLLHAAWDDSVVVTAARTSAARFNRLPAEKRFRVSALTLMWAALWHMALRTVLPAYATSAFPLWSNLAVATVALLAALASSRVVAAWPQSLAGRSWRSLRNS